MSGRIGSGTVPFATASCQARSACCHLAISASQVSQAAFAASQAVQAWLGSHPPSGSYSPGSIVASSEMLAGPSPALGSPVVVGNNSTSFMLATSFFDPTASTSKLASGGVASNDACAAFRAASVTCPCSWGGAFCAIQCATAANAGAVWIA